MVSVFGKLAASIGVREVVQGFEGVEQQFDEDWIVGSPLDYGLYLETGTSRMPPYPWLNPAVRDVLDTQMERVLTNVDAPDETIEVIAKAVARQARRNVNAGGTSQRSPGTHPSHPQVQTGNLIDSIEALPLED